MFKRALQSLAELWSRRELVRFLVVSNLKSSQKNSVLGYIWWLLDPLMLMLVYTVMMTILGRSRDLKGFPMFLFCALLPYKSFSGALQNSVGTIIKNQQLIKEVPFPKAVIPISLVITNFIHCAIGVVPLALVGMCYGIWPTWRYVYLPIPLFVLLVLTLGLSLFVSFFGVWFRDLDNILQFVTRLWWYLSPGLYAMYQVPGRVARVLQLNPLTHIFPAIRRAVYYPGFHAPGLPASETAGEWTGLAAVFAASLVILVAGFLVFVNNEHKFGKVL